jgi:hypothetical protein
MFWNVLKTTIAHPKFYTSEKKLSKNFVGYVNRLLHLRCMLSGDSENFDTCV